MNEPLKYEQLIGEKLQGLPVPGMQDAIWARVKAQLDIDLPSDDNEGGGPSEPRPGPGVIGWGLSVVIVALITAFFIYKNKPKTKNSITASPNNSEQVLTPSVRNNGPPLPGDNTTKKINRTVDGGVNNSQAAFLNDTVAGVDIGNVNPVIIDSAVNNVPPPLVILAPAKTDTTAQVKRGKGMKGLNDSAYRIVPKKN